MFCIAVGVTALIAVISVMNGFEKELTERILGMVAHATVTGVDSSVHDWQHAVEIAEANPHVRGAAPFVERQALLQGRRVTGGVIRGMLPDQEPKISELDKKMLKGRLDDLKSGAFGIALGNELAMEPGVGVGDKVTVYAPEVNVTPIGAVPRVKRCEVVSMFSVGLK